MLPLTRLAFNQPIAHWDTSTVTIMSGMFASTAFDQPIDHWDTSSVTIMSGMFASTAFDQPIDHWDTSTVTIVLTPAMTTSLSGRAPVYGAWDLRGRLLLRRRPFCRFAVAPVCTDLVLAMSRPVPANAPLFFSLATDDVVILSSKGPGVTSEAVQRLDLALAAAGIERHVGKDENDVLNSTCVGVCLRAGRWWWPPAARMWSLILGALRLCKTACGSSGALLAYLGVLQWFDILQRGKFSFYTALYRETRVWDDWEERALPADLLREVLCGVLLGPF